MYDIQDGMKYEAMSCVTPRKIRREVLVLTAVGVSKLDRVNPSTQILIHWVVSCLPWIIGVYDGIQGRDKVKSGAASNCYKGEQLS